jgi:hypothetical protein
MFYYPAMQRNQTRAACARPARCHSRLPLALRHFSSDAAVDSEELDIKDHKPGEVTAQRRAFPVFSVVVQHGGVEALAIAKVSGDGLLRTAHE